MTRRCFLPTTNVIKVSNSCFGSSAAIRSDFCDSLLVMSLALGVCGLKISTRLLAGFGGLVFLAVLVGGGEIWLTSQGHHKVDRLVLINMQETEQAARTTLALQTSVADFRKLLYRYATVEGPSRQQHIESLIKRSNHSLEHLTKYTQQWRQAIESDLSAAAGHDTAELAEEDELAELAEFKRELDDLLVLTQVIYLQLQQDQIVRVELLDNDRVSQWNQTAARMNELVDDMHDAAREELITEYDEFHDSLMLNWYLASLGSLVIFLFASVVGFTISRSINRPLALLQRYAEELGRGNHSASIVIKHSDEIGVLARTLSNMSQRIQSTQAQLKLELAQRHASELRLAELAEEQATVLNNVTEGIFGLDAQGRVRFVNALGQAISGCTEAQLLTQHYSQSLRFQPCETTSSAHRAVFSCNGSMNFDMAFKGLEAEFVDAQGQITLVEMSCSPVCQEQVMTGSVVVFRDISERRANETRLRLIGSVFEYASEAIMVKDLDHKIVDVNQAFERMTQSRKQVCVGDEAGAYYFDEQQPNLLTNIERGIARDGCWVGTVTGVKADGSHYPMHLNLSALRDLQHKITHYVGIFNDITELQASKDRLQQLAFHDALTGLPNRLLFQNRLEHSLLEAQRDNSRLGVLFIDLDNFKTVNDTQGHAAGDLLLIEVTRRLSECVRKTDTVARMGGDEFTIIVDKLAHTDHLRRVTDKILKTLQQPILLDGDEAICTGSIGIAVYPDDGLDSHVLAKHADVAMYRAKEQGRNRYEFYHAGLSEESERQRKLDLDLRLAIDRQEFELFYQPKVEVGDRDSLCMEALVRWNKPGQGIVGPLDFIGVMEKNGLIIALGNWIIRAACRQVRLWLDQGFTNIQVAVNLSPLQFGNPQLLEVINSGVKDYGLAPAHLEFEITESTMMDNIEENTRLLDKLRKQGYSIAMDDFGTGYSSLAFLKRFPVSTLKIDRAFINERGEDDGDAVIVTAIIAMAKVLDLKVVAEGVETEVQAKILTAMGCDFLQGFYFSRPLPAHDCEQLMVDMLSPKLLESMTALD